jgi:hypothetical protein
MTVMFDNIMFDVIASDSEAIQGPQIGCPPRGSQTRHRRGA